MESFKLSTTMSANQFMKQIAEALDFGDRLMDSGRNAEAIQVFEQLVSAFRKLESAQEEAYEGGPTQVPLSLRLMVMHRDISVPLSRLGDVHLKVGDYDSALEYLREGESRLEKAIVLTGGSTTAKEFEKGLHMFRKKIKEAQSAANKQQAAPLQSWIAYTGNDTNGLIRVFPAGVPASAERLRLLMSQAAQHQNGKVSSIYQAANEAEALRMAPYQFE